jgi:glycyl-tRNA synthetase beta chain
VEGGVPVSHELLAPDVREFVEERLESYLDVPVEFVRAARHSQAGHIGAVADLAGFLAEQDLVAVHEAYTRSARIVGDDVDDGAVDDELLVEPAERSLSERVRDQPAPDVGHEAVYQWAVGVAPVVAQFFDDVLVMDPDARVKANRLRLVRDVRDAVGRLGDLSQIPL